MVRLYASLNGVEYSDTGLTFTYFRAPKISAHTPHGGPVNLILSLSLSLSLSLPLNLPLLLTRSRA